MRILFITTIVLIQLTGCGAAWAIEIIYPDSHVGTVEPRISVVGLTDAKVVELSINGRPGLRQPVSDGIFHVRVALPYGLSKITVKVADDDSLREPPQSLQVLCGPRIPRDYEKVYALKSFHGREPRTECMVCHEPEGELAVSHFQDSWCYSCHGDIKKRFRTHGVSEQKLCTMCHSIQADMTRQNTGVYSDMNPCYKCHTDKIGEFAQDFIHGPVAGGTCTVCHNPHGSQFEANLKTPQPVLCLYCHTDVEDMDAPKQHEPFAKGRCTECHDPHATGNRWVLVKKTGELCVECHEDDIVPTNHRHPIGGRKPRTELVSGLNLDSAGHLECLTCHRPHGSQVDFLLRSRSGNGCRECHPEY